MRRVRASIKVGRRGKRNKETKASKGEGPARSRAEAGASVPRTGEPRPGDAGAAPTFPGGKGLAGSWSRTQEGGEALGLPGTVTATARPGECAELPKGCSAHGGTRSSSGGSGAAPRRGLRGPGSSSEGLGQRICRGGCAAGSSNPTAQTGSPGLRGHSPGSGLPPGQAEAGGPRTARTLVPRAEQISGPAPEGSRRCRRRAPELLQELNPGLESWPPPLGLFLLGPHGVNNPR